ncbi:A24 family peptidase [Streptomyces sp. SID3343]|uniref:prepilin peptidase n=1 Tax=Streptomyces sp. SID3343 TaxID=2690260 RepID=UPI00137140BD|nr:prepilin peptidase [Streptomyces sp. SID3343]
MRISPIPLDGDTVGVLRRDWQAIAVASAITGAAVAWRVGLHAVLPAFLAFTLLAVVLVVCDLRLLRLPDALTLPAYPLLVAPFAVPLDWSATARALTAMAAMFTGHVLIALLAGGIGLGDAKAAGLIGLALGWSSWTALAQGEAVAYLCAGAYAVVLVVSRRASRESVVPFGPFLLGATALVMIAKGV